MSNAETIEKRRYRKPSMRDVSARAQVSRTTVSDYLAGRPGACNLETARRIDAAVAELNYTHNSLIQGLRFGKTNCIGACIANKSDIQSQKTPYAIRFWQGLEKVANEYHLILLQYPASIRDGDDVRPFLDGRIDGLVMSPRSDDSRPIGLAAAGMPAVFTEVLAEVPANCGVVASDEADTANLALSHLWDAGHRRIAHLAAKASSDVPDLLWGIAGRRLSAYSAWMEAHDAFDPKYVAYAGGWAALSAEAAVKSLMSHPERPTAIYCANDLIAWAAIDALASMGIETPRDISIVGVDNANYRSGMTLTSLDVPVELMAETALRVLLRLLDGAPIAECHVLVPVTRLVAGDTVRSIL